MKTTLLELDLLGILATATPPKELDWMTDTDKQLLIDLHVAGECGLHKREIAKVDKLVPGTSSRLTAYSMADWGTDKTGKPVYFALSWQGEQAAGLLLRIALNQNASADPFKATNPQG